MKLRRLLSIAAATALITPMAFAAEFQQEIPMRDKGAATFYVDGEIHGFGSTEFMVDTGSGYMTINEHSLEILQSKGAATYVKELTGIMADGTRKVVPVYRISSINIGGNCELRNIEAAVFPGKTRNILGLSALKKAAPFVFSMNPPQLTLSHCDSSV